MELLTDGKRTVGLSWAGGVPSAVLVTSGAELVPSDHPLVDFWVISRPDGPGGAIWMNAWQDYGVLTGGLQAPPGSEVVVVRNVGVLVTPPVGKTYRPTFEGFEVVSEHRLLAANDQLRVEQRCDEQLSCTVVVVDAATDRAEELPEDFAAELAGISVSPDGRWLLNDTSPAWLFDRQTGQSAPSGRGRLRPAAVVRRLDLGGLADLGPHADAGGRPARVARRRSGLVRGRASRAGRRPLRVRRSCSTRPTAPASEATVSAGVSSAVPKTTPKRTHQIATVE